MSEAERDPLTGPEPDRASRRERRWARRAVRVLVFAFFLLAVGVFVFTRQATLRFLVEPALSRAFGGTVTVGEMSLRGGDTVLVRRLRLSCPDWPGLAGEVATLEDIELRIDPWSLFGTLDVRELAIGTVRLRLAEDAARPGEFNVMALRPEASGDTEPLRARAVRIGRLEVENGIVSDGAFLATGRRAFRGDLTLVDGDPSGDPIFDITLVDLDLPDGPSLSGRWNERTFAFDATLERLDLDERLLDLLPIGVKAWAASVSFTGTVTEARLAWAPDAAPRATLEVRDLAMSLPDVELGATWARFVDGQIVPRRGLPTVRLREARLEVVGDRIRLDRVAGEFATLEDDPGIVPLPVKLAVTVDLPPLALAGIDWEDATRRDRQLREAIDRAGFRVDLSVRGFDSASAPPGYPPAVEVPRIVAEVLETFRVKRWRVDVDATTWREPGATNPDGSPLIRVKGEARLANGEGAFEQFAYPLTDVEALFRFEDERIDIVSFMGLGSDRTPVRVRGRVVEPGNDAEVDVWVEAEDIPLDRAFLEAFDGGARRAMEELFDFRAYGSLAASGLLADPAADFGGALTGETFTLGGRVDFRINVTRELGKSKPIPTVGEVSVRRAGAVLARFPYPLLCTGGRIVIEDEAIRLGEGLSALTPAGGTVSIAGDILIPRMPEGGRDFLPSIRFTGRDDRMNPLLLAAIPPPDRAALPEWPGRTLSPGGARLAAARLAGALEVTGGVGHDAEGSTTFAMEVALRDGSIDPIRDERQRGSLGIPPGLGLRDMSADLLITDESVTVRSLHGRRGEGTVAVEGFLAFRTPEERFAISLADMAIEEWCVGTLPAEWRETGERVWAATAPRGRFDASVTARTDEAGIDRLEAAVTPREVALRWRDRTIRAVGLSGGLAVEDARIRADGLSFRLESDGMPEGEVACRGGVDAREPRRPVLDFEASIRDGRFESPAIDLALEAFAGESFREGWRERELAGRFDAGIDLGQGFGPERWRIDLVPKEVAFLLSDTRVEATLAPGAAISITPGAVTVAGIEAALDGGTARLAGSFDLAVNPRVGSLDLDLAVHEWTGDIVAVLPPPLSQAVESLDFAAESFVLREGRLFVRWIDGRGIADPVSYRFDAAMSATGARLDAGVPLTDIDGEAAIAFDRRNERGDPTDAMEARLGARSMRIFGRPAVDGSATLKLVDGGRRLELERCVASLGGGVASATGEVDLAGETYTAEIRIAGSCVERLLRPDDPDCLERGRLDAAVAIEGRLGDRTARVGRGSIRIRGAALASSPVVMQILQLTQAALPSRDSIEDGDIEFLLRGDTAQLERLSMRADGLRLDGVGTVDLDTLAIDATVRARGGLGPVSDLLGLVGDALALIRIRGTMGEPKAELVPLPAFAGAGVDPGPLR